MVPVIFTVAPIAPLRGRKSISVGVDNTLKSVLLLTIIPFNVSEIFPVVASAGTDVVMLVVVEAVTVDNVPLNLTILFAGIALNPVPIIDTAAVKAPPVGVKLVIVGVGKTVKFPMLVIVIPLTLREIGPVIALAGTIAVILKAVDATTVALTPLNDTTLSAGVRLKLVPEIVMVAPTAAPEGLNPVMVGVGNTVKSLALVINTPLTAIDSFPVVAPTGTVVVMLVVVDERINAVVVLNLRT